MSATIIAESLTKSFYSVAKLPGLLGGLRALFSREKTVFEAVHDVSFQVEPGEIVGFLGPNGAGKTTTIKMLTGILLPTAGRAEVLGYAPFDRKPAMLKQISLVMGNKMQLWWDLPAREGFQVLGAVYDVPEQDLKHRIKELSEMLEIHSKLDTAVRKLSLGERMKCELVAALLHRPKVLFLDEPTIGLDVVSQVRIREFLAQVNREDGSTILLTSHYMQDVEALCKRVIMIDGGRVAYDGALDDLRDKFNETKRLRIIFAHAPPKEELADFGEMTTDEDTGAISIKVLRREAPSIAGQILAKYDVADIGIEETPIEEIMRTLLIKK